MISKNKELKAVLYIFRQAKIIKKIKNSQLNIEDVITKKIIIIKLENGLEKHQRFYDTLIRGNSKELKKLLQDFPHLFDKGV